MMSEKNPDERSLGDDATLAGRTPHRMASELSLGDQSTFSGNDSSLADLGRSEHDPSEFELSELTNRYVIERSLGKGGMGEVLLAVDNRLKRKVAIKRVLAPGQSALGRFLAEAQALAALNHFNIVQVYDYGRDTTGPYLVMEYVEGQSLLDRLRSGPLPPSEAIELTCRLCEGLSKAHAAGIVHRDIKPANILLTTDGNPKLTDFGLAKQDATDHGKTIEGTTLGTLDYMPPEQRRDSSKADARSDLWSLAATLYAMVTAKNPRVIRIDRVPAMLQKVIGKGLEEDPADRFADAKEFRDALRAVLHRPSEPGARQLATQGECPRCSHPNSEDAKYCAGCASKLTSSCLSCGVETRVWRDICTQCGTRQSSFARRVSEEIALKLDDAASNLSDRNLPQAISILRALKVPADPRFDELKRRKTLIQEQAQNLQFEYESLQGKIMSQIEALRNDGRWGEIRRMISAVPTAVRRTEVVTADHEAGLAIQEMGELAEQIRNATAARDYELLQQILPRYLELDPRNEVAKRLLSQVLTKRSTKSAPPFLISSPSPAQSSSESALSTERTMMYMQSGLVTDQEVGPVSPRQLAEMLASRKVSKETLTRAIDESSWRSLGSYNGIVAEAKSIRLNAQQSKRASRAVARGSGRASPVRETESLDVRMAEHIERMAGWFAIDVPASKETMLAIAREARIADKALVDVAAKCGGVNRRMFFSMVAASALSRVLPFLFYMNQKTHFESEPISREGQIAGAVLTIANPLLGLGLLAASSIGKPRIEHVEEVRWPLASQVARELWRFESTLQPLVSGGSEYDLGNLDGLASFGKLLLTTDLPFGCRRPETFFLEEFALSAALLNARNQANSAGEAVDLLDRHVSLQYELLKQVRSFVGEGLADFERAFGDSIARIRRRLSS